MYKFVRDEVFLRQMGRDCDGHLKSFRTVINNDRKLKVNFKLLGEDHLKNTIQDGINPLEINYFLEIQQIYDENIMNNLKEYLIECFSKIEGSAFGNVLDSKYDLETKYIWYTTGNNTKFKLRISINLFKDEGVYRLIKRQNGTYDFELIPGSKDVFKKELRLKQHKLFDKFKEKFIAKKNKYLRENSEENHPTIDVYFEAINEIYKKNVK